jgi:hypothetical protein
VVSGVFSLWLASRVQNVEHSIPVAAATAVAAGDQVNRSNG